MRVFIKIYFRPQGQGTWTELWRCCYWNNHKGKLQDFCALLFNLIANKRDHVSIITVPKHARTFSNLFPYRLTVEVRLYLSVETKPKGKLRHSSNHKKT